MSNIVVDSAPSVVLLNTTEEIVHSHIQAHTVTIQDTSSVVTEPTIVTVVVPAGAQGPQGIPGASDTYLYLVAGEPLGGNRAVTTNSGGNVVYATSTSANVLGITTSATQSGAVAQIQINGIMTEASWSWELESPIFVGTLGTLTQTPPVSGSVIVIGYPILSNKIFIDKQTPILLG